jgi:WD40 repeat protein
MSSAFRSRSGLDISLGHRASTMRTRILYVFLAAVLLAGEKPIEASAQEGPKKEEKGQTDPYGDSLPAGAVMRLGTRRLWVGGKTSSIAFAPDGKTLAAVSSAFSRTVPIWDLSTGRLIRNLPAPSDPIPEENSIAAIAFASDGKSLAAGSGDGMIRIWDPITGRTVHKFQGNQGVVFSLAFTPNGKSLASSGEDGTLRLWDLNTGKEMLRFFVPEQFVLFIGFSPNGAVLASESFNQVIRLWDVGTGGITRVFRDQGSICSNAFTSDSKSIASVNSVGDLTLQDVATGTVIRRHRIEPGSFPGGFVFSPDHETLVVAGRDATLRLCVADTGKEVRRIQLRPSEIAHKIDISPDGKTIASTSGDDTTIQLWDIATGREKLPFPRHQGQVLSIAFSPNDRMIASGGSDGSLRLWDIATGKQIRPILDTPLRIWDPPEGEDVPRILLDRIGPSGSLTFSSNSEKLISVTEGGTVRLWDVQTGREVRHALPEGLSSINTVAFAPNGRTIAFAGRGGTLVLWDIASGKEIHRTPTNHRGGIRAICFSPNSDSIASGGSDGHIKLWETSTLDPRRDLVSGGLVESIAFSPDGRSIYWGGLDAVLRIFNLDSGQLRESPAQERPKKHILDDAEAHMIRSVASSPDGKLVGWSGDDRIVRIWDVGKGRETARFQGHEGTINQVIFSKNSQLIASGSDDGTILIWAPIQIEGRKGVGSQFRSTVPGEKRGQGGMALRRF